MDRRRRDRVRSPDVLRLTEAGGRLLMRLGVASIPEVRRRRLGEPFVTGGASDREGRGVTGPADLAVGGPEPARPIGAPARPPPRISRGGESTPGDRGGPLCRAAGRGTNRAGPRRPDPPGAAPMLTLALLASLAIAPDDPRHPARDGPLGRPGRLEGRGPGDGRGPAPLPRPRDGRQRRAAGPALGSRHSSPEAYARSVEPNRERLERIVGAVDPRVVAGRDAPRRHDRGPGPDRRGRGFRVYAVRWDVYDDVQAEGLLLEPEGEAIADVVAMADCDVTPEQFAGLAEGVAPRVAGRPAAGRGRLPGRRAGAAGPLDDVLGQSRRSG